MKCDKCNVEMVDGLALDTPAVCSDEGTCSQGHATKLMSCLKCPSCGKSVTVPDLGKAAAGKPPKDYQEQLNEFLKMKEEHERAKERMEKFNEMVDKLRTNHAPNPAGTGWLCPRCGRGNAPWVSSCGCNLQNPHHPWSVPELPTYPALQPAPYCGKPIWMVENPPSVTYSGSTTSQLGHLHG